MRNLALTLSGLVFLSSLTMLQLKFLHCLILGAQMSCQVSVSHLAKLKQLIVVEL